MSAYPPETRAASRRVPLPSPFALHAGGRLVDAHVAVETWGTLTPERDNAVLVFTGLSASAHAAAQPEDSAPGWWEKMIGSGRALDTDRFFVICVNSLGGCFGSTGPADLDPATGTPYANRFPDLRVEDIARAGHAAVEHFGIDRLAAVVGASLGGMTTLAHAVQFPGKARAIVSISGALGAGAYAIAMRALQREILGSSLREAIANGVEPIGEDGLPIPTVAQAMRWARKIGVLSYVGGDLLEQRFGREQNEPFAGRASGTDFEVESWLEHQANKFVRTFHPWSYWHLSRAMDLFEFGAHATNADDAQAHATENRLRAAAKLKLERALVIGVREDTLFPVDQQRTVAQLLSDAGIETTFVEMSSPYGHDAFLVEDKAFTPPIAALLNRVAPGVPHVASSRAVTERSTLQ
jgi:homoserine O-acetyltransferase